MTAPVRPYNPCISLYAISRKEILRLYRIWIQTIIPPLISTFLYFVIFGTLIGERILQHMEGHSFLAYITPGLIMMAVINNSYANVSSSFFSAKFQQYIEELLVSPTPDWVIMTGYVAGGIFRGLFVGFVVLLVAMWFVDIHIHDMWITISSVVLASSLFSFGGLINGILANKFDDVSVVSTFVLTPLTYLGGVFYSIHLLPEFWRNVSLFNPILYVVSLLRYGFLGVADIDATVSLIILIVMNILLGLASWIMLNRGIGLKK